MSKQDDFVFRFFVVLGNVSGSLCCWQAENLKWPRYLAITFTFSPAAQGILDCSLESQLVRVTIDLHAKHRQRVSENEVPVHLNNWIVSFRVCQYYLMGKRMCALNIIAVIVWVWQRLSSFLIGSHMLGRVYPSLYRPSLFTGCNRKRRSSSTKPQPFVGSCCSGL